MCYTVTSPSITALQKDYPGLKLSQLKAMIEKEWSKSLLNPANQR